MKLYWGDLHYHTAVGYAQGSPRRSLEIAQLDVVDVFNNGRVIYRQYPGDELSTNNWPRRVNDDSPACRLTGFCLPVRLC